jgi:metal-responsive CopG/Arc/MetJ family transcriptional regulator
MNEHTDKSPPAHLSLKVPKELLERIDREGQGTALTRSETIRALLDRALRGREGMTDDQEAP